MSTTYVDTSNNDSGDRGRVALPAHGVRGFALVSCGQFVAVSGLTVFNFAVAYFVYKTYPLLILGIVYALPFLVFLMASPIAGSLVDRWGPRRALVVSNVGGILLAATLAVLPFTHTLNVWHGFVIVMVVPVLKALLLPAFEASVPLLVPKRHIGRANGTRMLVNGAGAVLGPAVAGLLLDSIGIYGVVLLVCLSLVLGLLTLLPVRIPRAWRGDTTAASLAALLAEFREAWQYVRARHGLPALLVFFGVISFGIGFVEVLIPPLVLAFASPDALDTAFVVGVIGMAAAGLAMTAWGGPRKRVQGMLGYSLLFAAAMVIGSLRPNVMLITVAAFVFLGTTSIILGNIHTVLHIKVEPHLLGRVMGLKNVCYAGLLMLGDIMAGMLSGIFQPLIGADQVRSRVVATVVGGGPGRGFALLMMVMGVLIAICTLFAQRYAPLRDVEEALPDVTPADLDMTADDPDVAPEEMAPETARR